MKLNKPFYIINQFCYFSCIIFMMNTISFKAQNLEPNKSFSLVKLRLENPSKLPIEGQYLKIFNEMKTKFYDVTTDSLGGFELLLPAEKKYYLIIENFTGEIGELELQLPHLTVQNNFTFNYTLTLETSNELDISFRSNSYELDSTSYPYIDQLLNWLNENKKLSIEIRGHTDNIGSASSNLLLSKNRAESVRKHLIGKGIDSLRIVSKGLGETIPIKSNDSEEGRSKNRRTEIIVTN